MRRAIRGSLYVISYVATYKTTLYACTHLSVVVLPQFSNDSSSKISSS